MSVTLPFHRAATALLDRHVAPCRALGLLWLGGGLLGLLLFPALRGTVAGWGWMPLFLVLMPAAVLGVQSLLRAGAAPEAARRVMPRRAAPRHAGRVRSRRRRPPQRQLVALLLGLGLHRD